MGLFDAFWKKKTTLDELEATASLNSTNSNQPQSQVPQSTNPYLTLNSSLAESSQGFAPFQSSQQSFPQTPQITIGSNGSSIAQQQTDQFNSISPSVSSSYQQPIESQNTSTRNSSRDIELVLAKLDTIRAELDNIKYAVGQLDKKVDSKKSYL
jgi:hypothetical protein